MRRPDVQPTPQMARNTRAETLFVMGIIASQAYSRSSKVQPNHATEQIQFNSFHPTDLQSKIASEAKENSSSRGRKAIPFTIVRIVFANCSGRQHCIELWNCIQSSLHKRVGVWTRTIGYVIGHKFGSWLLLRYGRYLGLTTGRIKLGQYLFLRYGGKIVFFAQFVPVLRTLAGPFAGANLMPWRNFIFANVVSSCVWAVSYGYAAYWVGGEFERLQGRLVLPFVFIALIALIAGALFVHQREAQLITEAERAIPGPLEPR